MNNIDNFFMPAANTKPYFKAAIQGFAGTGKTYTAAEIAIGLHRRIGSKKPIVFFDTERASKFLRRKFEDAGIQLMVRESRTLADLKKTMEILRGGYSDILIVDSLSHIWEDFVEAYKNKPIQYGKAPKSRLEFQDWGILKPTWKREFSDPLVNDPYHFIFCGRAGYEYEQEKNDETGKREIYKSGIKMKVEGETAYEPDMLILMERFEEILTDKKEIYRQATIIKDRSTLLDGKTFKNPTYEDFSPAIEDLLRDPAEHKQAEAADSTGLFRTEEDKAEWIRRKDIVLEKIEAELVRAWPSTGAADKQKKLDALESAFNTRSWTEIGTKSPSVLEQGFEIIKELVSEAIAAQYPDAAPTAPSKPTKKAEKKETPAEVISRALDATE